MTCDIRWMTEGDRDQVLDLLGDVMDANRGYFSDSFRKHGATARSMLCLVDGEVASHIRIFDTRRNVGSCLIRAANIGDVCTHPRYRGRGCMTALLNVAALELIRQGYDIGVVYSGVPIYEKAGWVAFPEPDDALLWRLLNIRSLFARIVPELQARAAALAQPFQGVLAVTCQGQQGIVEFREGWCRPLDCCDSPDLTLKLDHLTFFRLLLGRDTPEELGLGEKLGLTESQARLIEALFPKRRPTY